jgi:hypothetical protein
VILPGALPEILTGLRIGLGVGWSTLVAAELIAATRGLGFMVQSAGEFLATDVVLAGIAVIAAIAFGLELGLRVTAPPDALAWRNTMSERLTITPLGPYIGAQVSGLDVTRPLSDNQFEQLYHAVLRHQVVFLRTGDHPAAAARWPCALAICISTGLSACGRRGGDYRSGYPQR